MLLANFVIIENIAYLCPFNKHLKQNKQCYEA